jgi:hypothetical protein
MALQTSGAISLNDMHVEAGGSSGTNCTINDTDIRGLIGKGSGATMSFNEWYGASAGPSSFSFNVTVGGNTNAYAQAGFNAHLAPSNRYGSPTTAVSITSNVTCSGLTKGVYPYAGSPSCSIYFNSGTGLVNPCTDAAYANMYYTVSGGGYTTGNIPIGSAARAARTAAYGSRFNFQSASYYNSSYNVNYAYNNYLHDTSADYLWPNNQPSTANNTAWVVTLYW